MPQNYSRSPNQLLRALPKDEYRRLEPHLTPTSLATGTILYQATEKIETVYFPNSALISSTYSLSHGSTVEIGLIGFTGMVGLPVIFGNNYSYHRILVLVEDSAMKISAEVLKREFERGNELQRLLLMYADTRLKQLLQLAACNRHHTIEERLARWLLTIQDLTQSKQVPLTHEFISNMLGVRRSGVTLAAGSLQQARCINYARGKITILNRESLKDKACECYQLLRKNSFL
ncbi:Crp/Fnr family transcriptional regulator [Pleurocapsales cyanobacterium LEGE 10410]|nr:Crp/Fnr family transcriptional regulator [Pleurocapsales cyanobacterium LEGE 10410]